jgi:hypothetical protein
MMAPTERPVTVTPRRLIAILRKEAAALTPNKQARNLWATIAARDMVSAGKVRLIAQPAPRRAA